MYYSLCCVLFILSLCILYLLLYSGDPNKCAKFLMGLAVWLSWRLWSYHEPQKDAGGGSGPGATAIQKQCEPRAHQSAYLGSALSDNSPFRSRSTGALEMPPLFSPGVKVSQGSQRSEGRSMESEV